MLEERNGVFDRLKKNMLSTVCITQDLLRYNFLLDSLLPTKHSVMLIGRTSTGKSTILRNYLAQKDGVAQ